MKMHIVLFVLLFVAGAWMTSYKASHHKTYQQKQSNLK